MNWFNQWLDTLYNTFIVDARYQTLISGFEKTIIITVGALIIGVIKFLPMTIRRFGRLILYATYT